MIRCLLDMDGLIADFMTAACKIHNRPDPYVLPEWQGKYGIDIFWGMNKEEFWAPMEHDFWANMPRTFDADQIVMACESKFGLENIAIVTSPSHNKECIPGKITWLERNYPRYRHRIIPTKLKHFLAHESSVLIDDYDDNITAFRANGGFGLLYPRPWNSAHSHSPIAFEILEETFKSYF